jgi:Domain of unknown function (DUF4267)
MKPIGLKNKWQGTLPYWLCIMLSIFFFFVGLLLIFNPEAGERFFGLNLDEGDNYSFQFTTAIRQIYLGVIILVLLWRHQFRALGFLLLTIPMIPVTDFLIVFTSPDGSLWQAFPHLSGLLVMGLGIYFIRGPQVLLDQKRH